MSDKLKQQAVLKQILPAYYCRDCESYFRNYDAHFKRKHTNQDHLPNTVKAHWCAKCGRFFTQVERHLLVYHSEKGFGKEVFKN